MLNSPLCLAIRKSTQQFLDDMLAEKEYCAFVAHLEQCHACASHVRSLGSLSNQIWRLGDVDVPPDLINTIMFTLGHPSHHTAEPAKKLHLKKILYAFGIALAVLTLAALFTVKDAIRIKQSPRAHTAASGMPDADKNSAALQQERLLEELRGIRTVLERSGNAPAENRTASSEQGVVQTETPPTVQPVQKDVPMPDPETLHWHFIYTDEAEKKRLIDALAREYITPDYKTIDLIYFKAAGDRVDKITLGALSASSQETPLRDFTGGKTVYRNAENPVFVYLENTKTPAPGILHWHIGLYFMQQRDKVLDLIRRLGGTIGHDSRDIVVFTIPEADINTLRKYIRATSLGFSESKQTQPEDPLSRKPVKISAFFHMKQER